MMQSVSQLLQDIDEAIHRLPQDVVDARMQRLKRAVDCSLKKSYLSKEIQDMQTPYSWYLKVLLVLLQLILKQEHNTSSCNVTAAAHNDRQPCCSLAQVASQ